MTDPKGQEDSLRTVGVLADIPTVHDRSKRTGSLSKDSLRHLHDPN